MPNRKRHSSRKRRRTVRKRTTMCTACSTISYNKQYYNVMSSVFAPPFGGMTAEQVSLMLPNEIVKSKMHELLDEISRVERRRGQDDKSERAKYVIKLVLNKYLQLISTFSTYMTFRQMLVNPIIEHLGSYEIVQEIFSNAVTIFAENHNMFEHELIDAVKSVDQAINQVLSKSVGYTMQVYWGIYFGGIALSMIRSFFDEKPESA